MKKLLDYKKLTKPISKKHPTGVNLRDDHSASAIYYQIKDIRYNARLAERDCIMNDSNQSSLPLWNKVIEYSVNCLTKISKDLEICAWLIEALLRKQQFSGLQKGFKITRMLIDLFWDDLFPLADDEGLCTKVAPFIGLNGEEKDGTLISAIYSVPMTESIDGTFYALWHYQNAIQSQQTKGEKQSIHINEVNSLKSITKAISKTDSSFYRSLDNDLLSSIDEYGQLIAALENKCNDFQIPSSRIRNALKKYSDNLQIIAKHHLNTNEKSSSSNDDNMNHKRADHTTAQPINIQKIHMKKTNGNQLKRSRVELDKSIINNRDDALALLLKISLYFKQHEPQSPIPYLLNRANQWGQLSLSELLNEIIENPEERNKIFRMTGIDTAELTKT